jgi:hypothetical protein
MTLFRLFLASLSITDGDHKRLPGGAHLYRISVPGAFFCLSAVLLVTNTARAATYYLAPAASGGSDYNTGLSASSPWLTPSHPVNCGDTIRAVPSTAYVAQNFNAGNWGTVSCPTENNVAWLQCEVFDACKITSTNQGIYVDHSYWGVQGWEVTTASSSNGFCFGVAPNYSNRVTVHHVIFANNVANGCRAGGFAAFNIGSKSVDYVAILGNIVYDSIQGATECYNGISIYQPVKFDSSAGTHIYVAGNFAWGNTQHNPCGGVQAFGGDGIILDTFDGTDGLGFQYTAQALVENNIVLGNGGHGIEVQNNVAGSVHATIYIRNNTSWGNEIDTSQQKNNLCAEILINSGYNVQELYNLVATKSATACVNDPIYALAVYNVNSTVAINSNFAFGLNGQNTFAYDYGTFKYAPSNVLGQKPDFKAVVNPGAPSCEGTSNVPSCVSSLISALVSTNSESAGTGYQVPSSSEKYDALFPQWICRVTLPAGLITKGC